MTNLKLLAVGLTLSFATAATAQDWSAEVYGGTSLERTEVYNGTVYDMDQGYALGVAVYNSALLPGFAVGVDVMGTRALYAGFPGEYIESLSLMASVRKEFALTPTLQGYVAGGLGLIDNTYEDAGIDESGIVPGAQIAVGARYGLGGATSVFGEIKHQVGLNDADLSDLGLQQSYTTTNLLIGLSFGF